MNHWMEHLKKLRKENPKLSFKEILKLGKKSYKKSNKQHKKSMKHEKKSKKYLEKSKKQHKKSMKHHKKSKKGGAKEEFEFAKVFDNNTNYANDYIFKALTLARLRNLDNGT